MSMKLIVITLYYVVPFKRSVKESKGMDEIDNVTSYDKIELDVYNKNAFFI